MTIWRFITFTDYKTKCHIAPASLVPALLADLKDRGHDIAATIKDIKMTGFEQGGMVHTQRPWETLMLDGLKINFPSEDVLWSLERLRRYEVRTFKPVGRGKLSRPYYKFHDHVRCLVLKPHHYDALETDLSAVLAQAETKAAVFWADKKSPAEVLRQANAKSAGVPVDQMPDYAGTAGHRVDRFIPKERGQA